MGVDGVDKMTIEEARKAAIDTRYRRTQSPRTYNAYCPTT